MCEYFSVPRADRRHRAAAGRRDPAAGAIRRERGRVTINRSKRSGIAKKARRLGRSGLGVSEICMGTMTFGVQADEAESRAILDRAFEAGVNFLDVAEVYPVPPSPQYAGRSEKIVGSWLKGRRRDSVIVATKVAGPSGGWFVAPVRSGNTGLDRHSILRAIEGSLQ